MSLVPSFFFLGFLTLLILVFVLIFADQVEVVNVLLFAVGAIFAEIVGWIGFYLLVLIIAKATIQGFPKNSVLDVKMVYNTFSYVYLARIGFLVGMSLVLSTTFLPEEAGAMIFSLGYFMTFFAILYFILVTASTVRSIMNTSLSGSLVLTFFIFFVHLFPWLTAFNFVRSIAT